MSVLRAATVVAVFAAVALAVSGASARPAAPAATLVFVDVGVGEGVVMRVGDAIVVSDIGEINIPKIYAALERLEATEIDVAILSHPHDDHIKNFELLLGSELFPVRRALLSRSEHWQKRRRTGTCSRPCVATRFASATSVPASATTSARRPGTILKPPRGAFLQEGQEGNASIAYLLELAGRRLLFTGDIERAGERAVVSRWSESEPTDLLLVTHHGSKNASHPFFLEAVKPEQAVISVGRGHGRGNSWLSAASNTRSADRRRGRPTCRRSTCSSCRNIRISSSFARSERPKRITSSNRRRTTQ